VLCRFPFRVGRGVREGLRSSGERRVWRQRVRQRRQSTRCRLAYNGPDSAQIIQAVQNKQRSRSIAGMGAISGSAAVGTRRRGGRSIAESRKRCGDGRDFDLPTDQPRDPLTYAPCIHAYNGPDSAQIIQAVQNKQRSRSIAGMRSSGERRVWRQRVRQRRQSTRCRLATSA
jgi:hypothetical protein